MSEQCTLPANESFTGMIQELIAEKKYADLLTDENGLQRAGGIITSCIGSEPPVIKLDNGQLINVSSIVAINGIFKHNYTCC